MVYTPRERIGFVILAAVGLVGINGVFLWAVLTRTDALLDSLSNPIAAVFIAEAFLLLGLLTYLLTRWKVISIHWAWFIALALLGSILFALPVALLWSERRQAKAEPSTDPSK